MAPDRYLYFPGCKIDPFLPEYDQSVRAVMTRLGIDLVDTPLNCCGYPVRHQDLTASLLSAARILAMAAASGLRVLTPCKCCFGNLKHANHWLQQRPDLAGTIAAHLRTEGLAWQPGTGIDHLLTVLNQLPVAETVSHPLTGMNVGPQYGCHALRPSSVTGFDDPLAPTIFESLIAALGARPVNWPLRLECCGQPLSGKNPALAEKLRTRKLDDARAAGADILATACTYCQLHFAAAPESSPTPVLYVQLLGLALGLTPEDLGLDRKRISRWGIE